MSEGGDYADAPRRRKGYMHRLDPGPDIIDIDMKSVRTDELLRLILTLSTNFIILPPDEIDEGIHDVLGAVGNFASVDRCYVFQFSENGRKITNTHRWRSPVIPPQLDTFRDLPEEELPWFFERIKGLGVLHVPDIGELPPKARIEKMKFFGDGIKSLLLVPMVYGYSLLGFLGMDSFREKKTWGEDVISLIKIVGEIFVNALMRKAAVEELRISEEKYRNIFENAIEGIFQVDLSGNFLSANPAIARMYGFGSPGEMIETVDDYGLQLYADPEQHAELMRVLIRDGRVQGFESRQIRKDATMFWTTINAHAVKDEAGAVLYYEGTVEDITERKDMEEMLVKERETFKAILERAPYGIVLIDEDGRSLFVNKQFTDITGYSIEDVRTGREWFSKAFPDPVSRKQAVRLWKGDAPRRRGNDLVLGVSCKDASIKEIEFKFVMLDDGRINATLWDLTQRRRAEEALRESEVKFRTLFEDSKDAIFIASHDEYFKDCNRSFLELFGYTMEEAMNIKIRDMYSGPEEGAAFMATLKEKESVRDYEVKLIKKNGAVMDCLLSATDKRDSERQIMGYQGIVRDITAYKRAEDTIRHMAYHDALTGLPNRALFSDRLTVAMAQARRCNERVAVVILDLDKFKSVNDGLGHKIGDLLLKAVADRLTALLRKTDTVARMGGDEFLIVLSDFVDIDDVELVVKKIVDAFRSPFILDSSALTVTTSIGVAIYPDDGEDTDTLVKRSDIAMYDAKRRGRNNFRRYCPVMEGNQYNHA